MQISDIFLRMGEERFGELMRSISMGRLRTFQLFDALKTRVHLHKLNSETLRNAAPRLWTRLGEENSGDLAGDLAQAILVSHLDLIKAVLDELGVPHEEGRLATTCLGKVSRRLSAGGASVLHQPPGLGSG
jgi:hypothetical protein